MTARRPLVLASRSPRRRALLADAGFACEPRPADIDDADLRPGAGSPHEWVAALAYLKARRVADALRAQTPNLDALVLGADTVVVKNGRVVGQPRNAEHAREIIASLDGGSHRVVTGVALLETDGAARRVGVDAATVAVGDIGQDRINAYLETDGWRGKAGAYNLAERIADGWPITYQGDPTTVMGLPMKRLTPTLERLIGPPLAPAGPEQA